MSSCFKLILLGSMAFAIFAAQGTTLTNVKSNRFERLVRYFDETQNECQANDICVLVQIAYTAISNSTYKDNKHYGSLDPRIQILMIKPNSFTPWLGLSDQQSWLPLHAPLFPRCCGFSEGNGLVSDFIMSGDNDLSKESLQLKVTVEFQKNIYKSSDKIELGSIHLSQMPETHEIIAHPNKYSTAMDDSYKILKMVPLKINNNVKVVTKSRTSDLLKTYKLVGVPNPNAIDGDTEGTPFEADFVSFAKPIPVYQMQFWDLNIKDKVISSLETADFL